MCCKASAILHILWNALFAENNYLIRFECRDFHILINPFTANIGYSNMCVGYIISINTSSARRDEVKTDTMFLNVKNDIFLLISNIILPEVLILLYAVQPEKVG